MEDKNQQTYSSCRLCIDYSPHYSSREKGFCQRVDDANFVFPAYTDSRFECHFNSPRHLISEQEAEQRYQEVQARHESFTKSLEQASKIVQSWPAWKQQLMHEIIRPQYGPNLRKNQPD
jgi:hypothetical protein